MGAQNKSSTAAISAHYGGQLAEEFIGQMEKDGTYLKDPSGNKLDRFRLELSRNFSTIEAKPEVWLKSTEVLAQQIMQTVFEGAEEFVVFAYCSSVGGTCGHLQRVLRRDPAARRSSLATSAAVLNWLGKETILYWEARYLTANPFALQRLIHAKTYGDFRSLGKLRFPEPAVLLEPRTQTLLYYYDDRGCELHFANRAKRDLFVDKYREYKEAYSQAASTN